MDIELMIAEKIKKWNKFDFDEFLEGIKKEMEGLRTKIKATDEQMEIAYKILVAYPSGYFADKVVEMHDKYGIWLWGIKEAQIYSVLGNRDIDVFEIVQYSQLRFVKASLEEIEHEIIRDECRLTVRSSSDSIPKLYKYNDFFHFGKIVVEELIYENTENEDIMYEIICPLSSSFLRVMLDGEEETIETLLTCY